MDLGADTIMLCAVEPTADAAGRMLLLFSGPALRLEFLMPSSYEFC